jgi:hypothetical protein
MGKLIPRRLLDAIAVCCLMAALAPVTPSTAQGNEDSKGTWMAGPGCGAKFEFLQHPVTFLYFCDGTATVEKAQWQDWGASKVKAKATMNEADLRHANSVAAAPHIRSEVTIIASHIRLCEHRRVYTSLSIYFNKSHKGPSTLHLASYLPPGCSQAK